MLGAFDSPKMSTKPRSIWVAVLAGGDGQRLRPLTTNARGISTPKQYCSLNGGRSLLQISLQRALAVTSRERIVIVVTEAHRRWWERELIALPRFQVVVQPSNRGTGLGFLLPLLVIAKSDPEAGVMFIPSDHYVEREAVLAEYLREATAPEGMDSDKLTLLGMSPHAPDSGFGYLSPVPDSGVGMRPVLDFIEKPGRAIATELIRAGGVWNSGIVAGRVSQFIALYPRHTRQMILDLQAIVAHWPDSRIPSTGLTSLYDHYSALDFSSDVLEKRPESLQFLKVPPCGWNDVSTPDRLANAVNAARSVNAEDFRFAPVRAFNLSTAFHRAAYEPRQSPASMIDSSHPQVAQRGFAWAAQSSRLAPYDES
jgi:mannose-1-phosphate guanylyltransferase